jgi:hypothetical protein
MENPSNNVKKKILSRIGKEVSFKYPGNERSKKGILKDQTVIKGSNVRTVPYWDVVDLIEFVGKRNSKWIRIGYYRKKQKLNWGSQTTITEPISIWKKIFINAAREKEWFHKLLEDVIKELKK